MEIFGALDARNAERNMIFATEKQQRAALSRARIVETICGLMLFPSARCCPLELTSLRQQRPKMRSYVSSSGLPRLSILRLASLRLLARLALTRSRSIQNRGRFLAVVTN